LIDAIESRRLDATIAVVISNVADAPGLDRALAAGIPTVTVNHRDWPSRDEFDRELVRHLRRYDVGLACLAGFMRLVGAPLLDAFPHAVLNIHPSLLPAFPGMNAQAQAVAHGVKVSGVTVHLVTPELDNGPIVLQRTVPVLDSDTPATLAARILVEEHLAYVEAVAIVLEGKWRVDGRRFLRLESGAPG
jgi:phosphoribosylglycinamide formyltransferase-1